MTTTPALLSPTASAPKSSASSAKAAGASDAGEQTSFAAALADATAGDTATPQNGTASARAQAANPASVATHLPAAGSNGEAGAAPVEGETQSTDAAASTDPTAMIAGATTQQSAQTTLALPGMPAAAVPTADAAAEGPTATDLAMPEAGIAVPSATPVAAPGQATAGASTPATAQATPLATPAAMQPASNPAQVDADAEAAIDAASATNTSSSNGQAVSKASATGVQTSPAQGGPATAAANASAATGAQVEVAVDAASSLQQKAGAVTETATTTTTTTTTQQSAHATSANHSAQTAAPAATLQVYTRFVERFDGRAQRFEVRLDPAELGRVDVRIEVGADKKVHAVLAAHDSAALNDLMRGHRALERMLTDAGIDLADGGVRFELASDSGRNASADKGESGASAPNVWRSFNTIEIPLEAAATTTPHPWRRTRLDLVA